MLTSIVLCLVAQTAAAQCVNATPAISAQVRPGAELIKTAAAADTRDIIKSAGPESRDIIKTAAGGARAAGPMRQAAPASAQAKADAADDDDHHHRTGSGMLLAALALMSGIALRRATASRP
ncbi:hypothetical protein [Ramlibacter sp.]|uniref:hypothetical protein n=1 Tax=Ramlibacter sp. TaxID=1917967 RepID=UPI002BD803CA|nr:hypothetical protein [Ramlibacter sp.]HWI82331.1 hypothetical protein [Ramlibacter sp.]